MGKLPRLLVLEVGPDAAPEPSNDRLHLKDMPSVSIRGIRFTTPTSTAAGDRPSAADSAASGQLCSTDSSTCSNSSSHASSHAEPERYAPAAVCGIDCSSARCKGATGAACRRSLPPLPLQTSSSPLPPATTGGDDVRLPLSRARSLTGMELARLALSGCSAAERELHLTHSSDSARVVASPAARLAAKLGLPGAAAASSGSGTAGIGRHQAIGGGVAGGSRARAVQSEGGHSPRAPQPVAEPAEAAAAAAEAGAGSRPEPAAPATGGVGSGGGARPGIWGRLKSMARGGPPAGASGSDDLSARHREEAGALPAGASAAAMRVLAELQERDEFSLVAAARQRSRRNLLGAADQQSLRSASFSVPARAQLGGGEAGAAANARSSRPEPRALGAPSLMSPSASAPTDFSDLMSRVRSCPDVTRLLSDLRLGEFAADNAGDGTEGGDAAKSPTAGGRDATAAPPQLPLTGARSSRARAEVTARSASSAQHPPALPSPVAGSSRLSRSRTGLGNEGPPAGLPGGGSSNGSGPSTFVGSRPRAPARSDMGQARCPGVDEYGTDEEHDDSSAAVRALAARYGSAAVVPTADGADTGSASGGLLGLDLLGLAHRDKSAQLQEALQAANPAAYSEEAAEAAEAAYRALAERAKLRLRRLQAEPTTEEAVDRQLKLAVTDLGSQRPFFLPPVLDKKKVERPFIEKRQVVVKEVVWTLDESMFAQRKKENEARDLFDTEKVHNQQLSLDWQRVVSKTRFRKMVARGDLGVKNGGQRLEEELGEVRQELEKHAGLIRSAFTYYSMSAGGITSSDILQMGANVWLNFCNDAGIVHPTQRGCTVQDLQTIFISVNFEEESETAEAEANDDDAMMRFEFMEGIVRAAFGKYIASKQLTDMSDAVARLLAEICECPDLPPEARVDPNDFRCNRFYTEQVEAVLKEYHDLLFAAFKLYKARDRCKLFWPEHWAAFLDSNKLLGLATGVERREAKLIYGWSQALVTDELRRRQRAVSLTFWDFVEAVARLADLISAPDHEDIIAYFLEEGEEPPELDRLVYEYYRHVGDAGTDRKRASAELVASPSRPLEVKLRLLLEYLVVSLREAWGGKDAKDVATKVLKMATYLSGGIEMG
ncbi:hypothetical protein HYH02_002691 [Chlamydomonas schloesseri]|uniref:Flagellar associated protein n=1 Tax=Chlamydomonas schloesseri TaxID=2026947 RepID=A0A835WS75_9CHLO|nr:hypothetical protein HYH02_002691 [Chlamydomonas schloesseri]|eukprot:KAG2452449.1 hypothetical protein HYH02_002691 [Chlamydomonas schloesseri]